MILKASRGGGLGQPVLDPVGFADHVKAHRPEIDGVAVAALHGEAESIVSENGVDLIGHAFKHVLQELSGHLSVRRCNELNDGELGRSFNVDNETELAFSRLHLGDVDVKKPDGVALELLAIDIRQP